MAYKDPKIMFKAAIKKEQLLLKAGRNAEALAQQEEIIEKGKDTFSAVAAALKRIKDEKLWVDKYDSWEAYLRERWDWGLRYGNQIVAAARVKEVVPDVENEAQARPFVRVITAEGQKVLDGIKAFSESPTGKAILQKCEDDYRAKQAAKAALEHPTRMSPDDVRYGMSDEKKLAIMISGKSSQQACKQLFGQIRGLLNAYMGNMKPREQDHFRELVCKELNSIIEEYKKPPAWVRQTAPRGNRGPNYRELNLPRLQQFSAISSPHRDRTLTDPASSSPSPLSRRLEGIRRW